jgi:hypothetical protein
MNDWYTPQERLNKSYPLIRKWLDENNHKETLLSQHNYVQEILEHILMRLDKLER